MGKFPITAIVVCINEANYLIDSLSSLSFCDEIIFADMGSSDNSIEIARLFTDHIVSIPRVQYIELVLNSLVNLAHNDWIISHDPDEIISPTLAVQIQQTIDSNPDLASIHTPIRFYFRGKFLNHQKLYSSILDYGLCQMQHSIHIG